MGERGDRGDFTTGHPPTYKSTLEEVATKPTLFVQETENANRVQMSLRTLEDQIDIVHQLLEALEDRLSSILGFANKEEAPEDKSGDLKVSPMVNRLNICTDSLVMANYRIRFILDRLEV